MSKRDTILKNLKQLTGKRKLSTACRDWEILNTIDTEKGSMASCELCSTAFRRGALMRRDDVTITVGGTCLTTLLQGKFSDRAGNASIPPAMRSKIEASCAHVCDPGDWLNWMFRRSVRSRKIAPLVVQLRFGGGKITHSEMDELIEYHDSKRLYPLDVLFPLAGRLKKFPNIPLKSELTLKQARALLKKHGSDMVRAESDEYERDQLQPLVDNEAQTRKAYKKLTPEAKRVVIALCKLTESVEEGEPVCEQSFAENFSPMDLPPRPPQWVWNRVKGVGFLVEDAVVDKRVELWLWKTGRYEKNLYDPTYWLDVQPLDTSVIGQLEVAAFSSIPL